MIISNRSLLILYLTVNTARSIALPQLYNGGPGENVNNDDLQDQDASASISVDDQAPNTGLSTPNYSNAQMGSDLVGSPPASFLTPVDMGMQAGKGGGNENVVNEDQHEEPDPEFEDDIYDVSYNDGYNNRQMGRSSPAGLLDYSFLDPKSKPYMPMSFGGTDATQSLYTPFSMVPGYDGYIGSYDISNNFPESDMIQEYPKEVNSGQPVNWAGDDTNSGTGVELNEIPSQLEEGIWEILIEDGKVNIDEQLLYQKFNEESWSLTPAEVQRMLQFINNPRPVRLMSGALRDDEYDWMSNWQRDAVKTLLSTADMARYNAALDAKYSPHFQGETIRQPTLIKVPLTVEEEAVYDRGEATSTTTDKDEQKLDQ